MKDVEAVIVNWNSGELLGQAVHSLRQQGCRVIRIVDNASVPAPALEHAEVEWVRLTENRGFAAGANAGIEPARSRFVLLLNPDVRVVQGSVERLLEQARTHPRAAILCGPLLGEDGTPQTAFQLRRLPTVWTVLSDVLFVDEVSGLIGRPAPPPSGLTRIEQPAAAYWLMRRRAWQELGGFDEDFAPAWFEDVDFCKRLGQAGWEILFLPQAPARHRGGYSLQRVGRARFLRTFYSNLLLYLSKHHPRALPWLKPAVKLGLTLRLLGLRVWG
ncbi:MAG TPA: glycosyltransferase family 2 protein [Acidobacteriota bacterium]|nr:glycosyltransferase family 2 protein [Acidobacteriota bacterium]